MFAYFYQFCLLIFLLQGIATPFLLAYLGALSWRQSRRLETLKKELESARRKDLKSADVSADVFELILQKLPKLRPLNCAKCGGSMLLEETTTFCPFCLTRNGLPEDYAAAVSLKSQAGGLLKSAVRHWRTANVLTHPAARWVFLLLIFIEPLVLFPVVLIGSNVFPDTWADRALAALGETAAFVVVLPAFLGFVVWMIVFMFLAGLCQSLRRRLPVMPVFERGALAGETSGCQTCGGGIEYDAGDLARLCSYCNVVNFRARFARTERAEGEKQAALTKAALFGSMEIIEDYVGTSFGVLVILVGACTLLTIFYAVRNLL